eukprot:scaffold543_cov119-Cylindrotheca_fusiformis.AAC.24
MIDNASATNGFLSVQGTFAGAIQGLPSSHPGPFEGVQTPEASDDDGDEENISLNQVEQMFLEHIAQQKNGSIRYAVLPTLYAKRWGPFPKTRHKLGFHKFLKMLKSFRSMETYLEKGELMVRRRLHSSRKVHRSPRRRHRLEPDDNGIPAKRRRLNYQSPQKKVVHTKPSVDIILVDTYEVLNQISQEAPFQVEGRTYTQSIFGDHLQKDIVAVDCIGDPDNMYLILIATEQTVFILDCVALDANRVYMIVRDMLRSQSELKLFHDVHNAAAIFAKLGGMDGQPQATLDIQLVMEAMTGRHHAGLGETLEYFGIEPEPKCLLSNPTTKENAILATRPIRQEKIRQLGDKVRLILEIATKLVLTSRTALTAFVRMTDARIQGAAKSGGFQHIAFDTYNSHKLASYEFLEESRSWSIAPQRPLVVSSDIESLLWLLQHDLRNSIGTPSETDILSDIVMDKGRRAVCWINGKRVYLGGENRIVNDDDMNQVVAMVGNFGDDNRAGMDKQLHRISAVRNRKAEIVGLTLRVGRHIEGNADIIRDLLYHDASASILFMGEPGSGKTTVIRAVTQQLAENSNVCIVDTSNEIAGDGDIPHPCVGHARRMMVPSLDQQSDVMIECVQNHTPAVLVIDEIGRPTEVEAARTCKHRGVRLIASAHGDLRGLVKNPNLRGLVGEVKQVTVGDAEAKKKNGKLQKIRSQRAGPSTFDIIVELGRENPNHWRIILNVGQAVDAILDGTPYQVQRRIRDPESGAVRLKYENI